MYLGRYYHAVEQKGRVSVPVAFRSLLGESSILTRGLDGSLFLFSSEAWKKLSANLEKARFTKKAHRDFVRLMAHDATPVEFDDQGRMLIPEHLRILASLKKDVVFAGSVDHVEIWDRDTYHTYLETLEKQAEDIAERFDESFGGQNERE